MGYYEDVLASLARDRRPQPPDPTSELLALRRQVATLQRTVASLAALIEEDGLSLGAASIRKRVEKAMRTPIELDDLEPPEPRDAPAMVGSAYRGAVPTGGSGCAACGAAFHRDDPELSLPGRGRVCVACYQRAPR